MCLWQLSLLTDAAVFKATTKTTTPRAWLLLLHDHRGRLSHNNSSVGCWLEGGWLSSDWWWVGALPLGIIRLWRRMSYLRWLVRRERRGAWFLILRHLSYRWFLRCHFVWMYDRALNLSEKTSQHSLQSHIVLAKQLTYVISVFHNLIEARWWRNEAIEMHIVNISMGLVKPK